MFSGKTMARDSERKAESWWNTYYEFAKMGKIHSLLAEVKGSNASKVPKRRNNSKKSPSNFKRQISHDGSVVP